MYNDTKTEMSEEEANRRIIQPEQPTRSYLLQRGGHAGGHLRNALLEALNHDDDWWKHVDVDFYRQSHRLWWDGLNQKQRAEWLLGQLWNCTDTLPSEAVDEVYSRDPYGNHNRTYAVLARLLSQDLKLPSGCD